LELLIGLYFNIDITKASKYKEKFIFKNKALILFSLI